ncbi:hypothetical protein [Streptomyces regalis]|uniref:hypothetical protein n=1 Tax=Streptomyces regalis TaxID=68262 RepID=UPI000AEC6779|nr:hypothetical protein [Streptomyces regalis]
MSLNQQIVEFDKGIRMDGETLIGIAPDTHPGRGGDRNSGHCEVCCGRYPGRPTGRPVTLSTGAHHASAKPSTPPPAWGSGALVHWCEEDHLSLKAIADREGTRAPWV